MIAIIKSQNKNKIPESLKSQKCKDNLKEVIDLSDPEHKGKIKPKFYGASDVLEKLKNLYHNKCAYCETLEPEFEIEHYRPKKRVSEDLANHKGYYWLAYEWTNLLPACHDCNKNGVKENHFPIEGTRKYEPKLLQNSEIDFSANKLTSQYLEDEKPLFLNPEMPDFDPFYYFKFDKTGFFEAKQPENTFGYRQAEKTIGIVKLNREKLYYYRREKILAIFYKNLKQLYTDFLDKELNEKYFKKQIFRMLDNIKENSKPNKEYSFFWSYVYKNFDFYIINYFKGKKQVPFLKFYREHKTL